MKTPIAQSQVNLHCCDLTKHKSDGYGEAIAYCTEREDGSLWATNSEYGTQVNFCPACGFQARVKVADKKE